MPEQPRQKLSPKQMAFVEYYLCHWNGARAAREAGYSEKNARVQGSQLLADPVIQGYRDARLAELQMQPAEVHKRLTDDARANLTDFLDVREREYPLWSPKARYGRGDIVERDDKAFKAIAQSGPITKRGNREKGTAPDEADGVEEVDPAHDMLGIYWQKVDREKYVVIDVPKGIASGSGGALVKFGLNKYGQPEIELVDSLAAKVHIGRMHKMFTDKIEETVDEDAIAAVESLDQKLQDLADRMGTGEGGMPA